MSDGTLIDLVAAAEAYELAIAADMKRVNEALKSARPIPAGWLWCDLCGGIKPVSHWLANHNDPPLEVEGAAPPEARPTVPQYAPVGPARGVILP